MRLLVTGGAGFIGSRFVKLWSERHAGEPMQVLDLLTYAGSRENLADVPQGSYQLIEGSITDAEQVDRIFREFKPEGVIHFAAESHVDRSIDDPAVFLRTNVLGTFTLLEAARRARQPGFRFLHVSTDEVYGSLNPGDPAFTERTPYDPRSPYSASKAGSDHLVSAYFHTFGIQALISNCSNNYGPYQYPEKLIPITILSCLGRAPIPVYGTGANVRDWLYVEDHCEALEQLLLRGRAGEKYNIGGAAEVSNLELVREICRVFSEEVDPSFDFGSLIGFVKDRPGHDFRYAMDFSKLRSELGWEPRHRFSEGMRRTVRWYLKNPEWIRRRLSPEFLARYERHYGRPLALPV